MAKLVDPDSLNRGTEIVFNTGTKRIQLQVSGNLDDTAPGKTSGVTLQAVYSKCKELWQSETADLGKLKFPFDPITEVKFDLINSWDWEDQQTKDLIRDGGWSLRDTAGVATEEYMGIISLGSFNAPGADLGYYSQIAGFNQTTSSFDKTGEINEPVQISGSGFDYDSFFRIFLREQGKLYDESNLLVDQDITSLDYTVYRIPLANATDPKVTETDANIDSQAPYTGMTIDYLTGSLFATYTSGTNYVIGDVVQDTDLRWYRANAAHNGPNLRSESGSSWDAYIGERQIGASYYAFNRIVEGNSGSLEEIYEFTQRELRRDGEINDDVSGDAYGIVSGVLAIPFCTFVGDTLQTQGGVYIDNFDINDTNRIQLFDITVDGGGIDSFLVPVTTTQRTFPFVAAGNIVFNDELVNDANATYVMYFTNDDAGDDAGNDFDTVNAIVVQDNNGNDISGTITVSSVAFDFDYDGNVQRGATSSGSDAPVTIVAQGLSGAQWVSAEFTISRATGLSFPVNAAKERVYNNP